MDVEEATQVSYVDVASQREHVDVDAICILEPTGSFSSNVSRCVLKGPQNEWTFGRSNTIADFGLGDSKRLSKIHFLIWRVSGKIV